MTTLEEKKSKLDGQVDTLENENRDLKKKLMGKTDQHEVLEKEYGKVQDKYRDMQNAEFNLST